MRFKIVKTLIVLVAVLLIALVSVSILIRSSYVQNKLITVVKDAVENSTGQQLDIAEVQFDIVHGVVVKGIQFNIDGQQFLNVDNVSVGYPYSINKILGDITAKSINIQKVEIDGLTVHLVKGADNKWNYQKISNSKEDKNDRERAEANWEIAIKKLQINSSNVILDDAFSQAKKTIKIKDLSSLIVFNSNPTSAQIQLNGGEIQIEPGGIKLSNISSSRLKFSKNDVVMDELAVDVNGSRFALSASIKGDDEKSYSIKSSIDNFVYNKLKLNLNLDAQGKFRTAADLTGSAALEINKSEYLDNSFSFLAKDVSVNNSILNIKDAVFDGDFGKANMDFQTDINKIANKNDNNEFQLDLELSQIDVSKITNLLNKNIEKYEKQFASNIDSKLRLSGFYNSKQDFYIAANIEKFNMSGDSGGAIMQGDLSISQYRIDADLDGELNNLNLKHLLSDDHYASSINSKINLDAVLPLDFNLEKVSGNIGVDILESRIFGNDIKDGRISAKFSPGRIDNAEITLNSRYLDIDANGRVGNEKVEFSYDINTGDLSFLSNIKDSLDFEGEGDIKGNITGNIQHPKIAYSADMTNIQFMDINAESLVSSGSVNILDEGINVDGIGKLLNLNLKNRLIQSADFKIFTKQEDLYAELLAIENQNSSYELEFNLPDFVENREVEVTKLNVNLAEASFANTRPFRADFEKGLKIDNLALSGEGVSLTASVDIKENRNLFADIDIQRLELQTIKEIANIEDELTGDIKGRLRLSGAPEAPKIDSNIDISDFQYGNFISSSINLDADYSGGKFLITLGSILEDGDKLNVKGAVNSTLQFNGLKTQMEVGKIDLILLSKNLNLSPLSNFISPIDSVNGSVDLDLKIQGTPDAPKIYGDTKLKNTEFKSNALKNNITIESGDIVFNGDSAKLNNFVLASGDGSGRVDGEINFSDLRYNFDTHFDQFRINPKNINTNVNGNINLEGENKNIFAEGKIKLTKTRISIKEQKKKQVSEIKFVNGEEEGNGEIVIKDEKGEDYFRDHVALDMDVDIPSNSWVRGRGANVEIKGGLKIDKEYEDQPLITGGISTVRGTYKIFGKLFKIQEGNVNFPGIKDLNPLMDITALYNVSDVDVFVSLGGDVQNPTVALSSNPSMQETDIISYLIFGTSSDKLGTGQRSSLGQVAGGLAGGVALNQLKGVLGDDISPDVLSFGTGTNGPELEVGKYLNDDLYLAYERKSSSESGTSIPTNTVKVEYRLFDFLSVGSDVGSEQSGGDLFFKFDF